MSKQKELMDKKTKIAEFVKKHSYLNLDGIIEEHYTHEDTLSFETRDNGNVGEEEYGEEDYTAAENIQKLLNNTFDNINIDIDVCDEWVILNVEVKNI